MTAEKVIPFTLSEFSAAAPPAADAAPENFSRADIERARAEGFEAGAAAARNETATRIEARLADIATLLERERAAFDFIMQSEGERLTARATTFLERFATGLAAARELEAARDLLARLMAEPRERAPALLCSNPASIDAIGDELKRAISKAGAEDFVSLVADSALARGDFALRWNGGGLSRSLEDALAAIENLFPQSKATATKEPAS